MFVICKFDFMLGFVRQAMSILKKPEQRCDTQIVVILQIGRFDERHNNVTNTDMHLLNLQIVTNFSP